MTGGLAAITFTPGMCWWCGAPADSREHRLKASDLRREYGKPPYTDLRTLTRFSGDQRHEFRGVNSKLVKFQPTLCARCNDTRSQPLDEAWDTFARHVADNEAAIVAKRRIDWTAVFGPEWRRRGADVERYVLKHALCRMIDQLPGPITIAGTYIDFLDGGARPDGLHVDLAVDLGVVEMLRATRANPPEDEPEAAEAGFLGNTGLWVDQDESTGEWTNPQAATYYRYMAIFWMLADGSTSPFTRRRIKLDTTDAMFGPDFREALRHGGETAA